MINCCEVQTKERLGPVYNSPMAKSSVWKTKPWWCQPWTILLTGSLILGSLYLFLGISWLSVVLAVPILGWWWLFLIIYPAQYGRE